jgi:hypothetical protein
MNLRNETDQVLITKTVKLVREERELLTAVLHHLREIDRRRLYSSLQYKSLFDFTVRHLGYSEDQAYRRINAMKLLRELPEVEEQINAGDLSLTHIDIAQKHFRTEKKFNSESLSRDEKLNVLKQIAKKPVREAERITLAMSSAPAELKPDRIRTVSEEQIELKFTAKKSTKDKIEKLKGLLAHKHPNISLGELIEKLCDLGLEQWDPSRKPAAPQKRCVVTSEAEMELSENSAASSKASAAPLKATLRRDENDISTSKSGCEMVRDTKAAQILKTKSAAQIRRDVFANAMSACENCGSTFALEIDHIQPQALGGNSTEENLRLLCKSCNQRAAIKVFGVRKMGAYLGGFSS